MNNQYYYNYQEETSYQVCAENAEERMLSSLRQKPNGIPDLDLQLSHSGNEQFRKVCVCLIFKFAYLFWIYVFFGFESKGFQSKNTHV